MSGRGCVLDVCLFVCWQWLGASVLAFWFDLISMAWGCQQSSLSVTPSSKAKTVASFDIIATPIMVGWQLAAGSWLACLTGQCGAWLQFVQLVVIYLTRPASSLPTVGACATAAVPLACLAAQSPAMHRPTLQQAPPKGRQQPARQVFGSSGANNIGNTDSLDCKVLPVKLCAGLWSQTLSV